MSGERPPEQDWVEKLSYDLVDTVIRAGAPDGGEVGYVDPEAAAVALVTALAMIHHATEQAGTPSERRKRADEVRSMMIKAGNHIAREAEAGRVLPWSAREGGTTN